MLGYTRGLYLQFRRFPPAIRRFYVADIWFALSRSIFGTLFNLHLLHLGYNTSSLGSLQLVASLCSALLAVPVGLWADRFGRRRLYVAGSLLFALPYVALPFSTSFPAILCANTLGTAGLLMAQVNEAPLLAAEVDAEDRPAVFSIMMVNFMFWNVVGTQLSGFVVKWFEQGSAQPYLPALLLSGVFALLTAVLRALLPFRQSEPQPSTRNSYLPSRTSLALAVVSLFSGGYTMLMQGFGNVILANRYHLNEVAIATALTIASATGWLGALLLPAVSRRFGVVRTVLLIIVGQAILFPVMGWLSGPMIYQGAFWLREFLGTMQMTIWGAFAMGVAPEQERATVNSFAMVGRYMGGALAAKAYGDLLTAGSYPLAFLAAGVLAVLAAGALLLFFRPSHPRVPHPEL